MTKQILVIDNEQYIQEVTQICLQTTAGWQVITASSGQEGIATAAEKRPDAILLDVMMPDMDGTMTFQKLQENPVTREIPVVLLTAKVQASDRRRYDEMGVKGAIAKPFNPLQLASQVADLLGWSL
ncbi:response regulator [Leptolyngbya ohadii]|uniref:response regulator n=1 Tax=Leptolyngbya ohadii TaxID=1962290 RepID=UPI000B598B22|nr:response regulator [Leptolyngbya ohadii]